VYLLLYCVQFVVPAGRSQHVALTHYMFHSHTIIISHTLQLLHIAAPVCERSSFRLQNCIVMVSLGLSLQWSCFLTTGIFDTHSYLPRNGNGALAQILTLRMSVHVAQAEGITSAVYLSTGYLFLHSHDLFILDKSTSDKCVCVCVRGGGYREGHSVLGMATWKHDRSDQANTWRVYPSTDVCHINQVWK